MIFLLKFEKSDDFFDLKDFRYLIFFPYLFLLFQDNSDLQLLEISF